MAEEGCLAQDRSLAQGEELDNPEFFSGQRQLCAGDQRQMTIKINFKVANRYGRRAVPVRAANNRIKVCQQFKPVKRLGQIAISAGTECRDLVVRAGIAGHNQNGDRHMVFADQARKTGAITVRKIDIQQHGIDSVVLQFGKRSLDIVRGRLKVAGLFKSHAQNVSNNRIFFNNKNMHGKFPRLSVSFSHPGPSLEGIFRVGPKPGVIVNQTVMCPLQTSIYICVI